MPSKVSAGLLMYKIKDNKLYVFLVHPGGPFWKNKDQGAWSIPKGELDEGEVNKENLLKTAIREFKEEIGLDIDPNTKFITLNSIKQKSGKTVHAWAFESDWHGLLMCSSYVKVEYPYKSGKLIKIPEIDKAEFFNPEIAKKKINPAQVELIERLEKYLEEKK